MSQIVIASRLSDGRVVFLAANATNATKVAWKALLPEATIAGDDHEATRMLTLAEADAAATQDIVDPYLIDVVQKGGEWRPTKYREVIRCLGPTMRLDLGKQAEGASA